MSIAEWRLTILCDNVYHRVRLDFLRISILTGNTGAVWKYDEFALGFLCTRVEAALNGSSRVRKAIQQDEVLFRVMSRLLGPFVPETLPSSGGFEDSRHGLGYQDGVALARRVDLARASHQRGRASAKKTLAQRSLELHESLCLKLSPPQR